MHAQGYILLQALGWTLVHFSWQGALIGLVYGLSEILAPTMRSRLRYGFGLAALLAMAGAGLTTFAFEAIRLGGTSAGTGFQVAPAGSFVLPAVSFSRLLPWLDTAWFAGVLILSARTAGGLIAIHRLKRDALPAPKALADRVLATARRLGLTRVRLCLHAGIDGPLVVGVLRAIIYLPVSAVSALSPDQLDAVLAHELEHIRRADYAWNLVQSAVETLFFFHPVVWWLGQRLRDQRELCCDDAVRARHDPLVYASALLHLEEHRQRPHLAVALNGHDSGLLARVRRILGEPAPEARPAVSRGALLALPLVIAALSIFAFPTARTAAAPLAARPAVTTLPVLPAIEAPLTQPHRLKSVNRTSPQQITALSAIEAPPRDFTPLVMPKMPDIKWAKPAKGWTFDPRRFLHGQRNVGPTSNVWSNTNWRWIRPKDNPTQAAADIIDPRARGWQMADAASPSVVQAVPMVPNAGAKTPASPSVPALRLLPPITAPTSPVAPMASAAPADLRFLGATIYR